MQGLNLVETYLHNLDLKIHEEEMNDALNDVDEDSQKICLAFSNKYASLQRQNAI